MRGKRSNSQWCGMILVVLGLGGCQRSQPVSATLPSSPLPRAASPLFNPGMAETLLETPERDKWQKPRQVVDALKLQSGETIGDVGAGSGYLLPYLSKAAGPKGTVYAEEIQEDFLPMLQKRATKLPNVHVLLGTSEDPHLPTHSIDCYVLLTVYHEVEKPVAFLKTLLLSAHPQARLAIIDFDARRKGNPPAPVGHEVATETVIAEARAAGWELQERQEFLSSQFFLIFRPQASGK